MQSYQHRPLDHSRDIRVIIIHPAPSPRSPLVCDLVNTDRDAYEALSYVWGSNEKSCSVLLQAEGQHLPVTRNLHEALRHLRYHDKERIIWADGLCINQSDIAERNSQVALMSDIYLYASRVVIWLGSGDAEADFGFSIVKCFERFNGLETILPKDVIEVIGERALLHCLGIQRKETVLGDHSKCMSKLYSVAWPQRAWTLQEVTNAVDSIYAYGWRTIPGDLFQEFIRWCAEIYDTIGVTGIDAFIDRIENTEASRNLLQVYSPDIEQSPARILSFLVCLRCLHCSDPRDKIFSAYTTLAHFDILAGPPDYKLTAQELYMQVTYALLSRYNTLQPLMLIDGPKRLSGVPSWTIDWTSTGSSTSMNRHDTASCHSLPSIRFSRDQQTLIVKGITIGYIVDSSKTTATYPPAWFDLIEVLKYRWTNPPGRYTEGLEPLCLLLEWMSKIVEHGTPVGATGLYESLLRALMNVVHHEAPQRKRPEHMLSAQTFDNITCMIHSATQVLEAYLAEHDFAVGIMTAEEETLVRGPWIDILLDLHQREYDSQVLHSINSLSGLSRDDQKSVFMLDTGHIVMAYRSCTPGDAVTLIAGVQAPMVLRRTGEAYRVIGCACVDAAMDGELWPDEESRLEELALV